MTATGQQSSTLNRAECKRRLINASQLRYYWQQFEPRVSEATLDKLEAILESAIRNHVAGLPSKGRTI